MRYVIYSEEMGVYLGNLMGLGFWSKLDPVGQDAAVTIDSEAACMDHVKSWDNPINGPWKAVPVTPDMGTFASIERCVEAGLPRWTP